MIYWLVGSVCFILGAITIRYTMARELEKIIKMKENEIEILESSLAAFRKEQKRINRQIDNAQELFRSYRA